MDSQSLTHILQTLTTLLAVIFGFLISEITQLLNRYRERRIELNLAILALQQIQQQLASILRYIKLNKEQETEENIAALLQEFKRHIGPHLPPGNYDSIVVSHLRKVDSFYTTVFKSELENIRTRTEHSILSIGRTNPSLAAELDGLKIALFSVLFIRDNSARVSLEYFRGIFSDLNIPIPTSAFDKATIEDFGRKFNIDFTTRCQRKLSPRVVL